MRAQLELESCRGASCVAVWLSPTAVSGPGAKQGRQESRSHWGECSAEGAGVTAGICELSLKPWPVCSLLRSPEGLKELETGF